MKLPGLIVVCRNMLANNANKVCLDVHLIAVIRSAWRVLCITILALHNDALYGRDKG